VVCNPSFYEHDGQCLACGSIPCAPGKYYAASHCGAQHPFDTGCLDCVDCVEDYGERTKAWGVCGGPDNTLHPDPDVQQCLNPGRALCEVCSNYVPLWGFTQFQEPDNISLCSNDLDKSWWFLSGKTENDLITCCQEAADIDREGHDCVWAPPAVESPFAAHYSCLYNHVATCMGIHDPQAGGWAHPTAYPADPMPW